jgi:hypothetical protein
MHFQRKGFTANARQLSEARQKAGQCKCAFDSLSTFYLTAL